MPKTININYSRTSRERVHKYENEKIKVFQYLQRIKGKKMLKFNEKKNERKY